MLKFIKKLITEVCRLSTRYKMDRQIHVPTAYIDNLTKDDILDAFNLLDYSLTKLYDTKEKEIKKLTKEINKKRAPLSTKRKKSGT
jgi:hypothetical protein